MSDSGSTSGDIFDLQKLRRLVELMNKHGLGEVDLRDGNLRVRLRKEGLSVVTHVAPPVAVAPAAGAPPTAPAKPPVDDKSIVVKSPMVGTFFTSSSPEASPFVKVGDHVGPESVVCIIEAMKVFNEIPAECSGQITAVLAQNGEAVEYGQPLFRVSPSK